MPQKRTSTETQWHEAGKVITVPAGEAVDVIRIEAVPDRDRSTIAAGIAQYAKHGRTFVPIKIRDWFAMIDAKLLS